MADVCPNTLALPLRAAIAALALVACIGAAEPAAALPPYRSADAIPPTPGELGVRLGLAKADWRDGEAQVTAPLLRSSYGLPNGYEVIGQVEYSPRADRVADAAVGGKWARPVSETVFVGVETLAQLPVRPGAGGVGIETLFVTTLRGESSRLHLNVGGFHDPRHGPAQSGWRASALAEFPRGDTRYGLELFGKDSGRSAPDLRAGAGLIRKIGRFDVRTAVHLGLSRAAPDASASLWLTTTFPPR